MLVKEETLEYLGIHRENCVKVAAAQRYRLYLPKRAKWKISLTVWAIWFGVDANRLNRPKKKKKKQRT